ncbi:hypothetical protein [Actinomadura kijaniata]|uniref:hypothetical protein n=1 Tax=Actinomadura kijaniata TaxID=46161 RepID=UPI00082EE720|nr:hypothetical protein [Actinomadura kijaniata]
MRSERLASEAVAVLATAVTDPVADERAAGLHDLVRHWFLANGRFPVYELFTENPADDSLVRALLRQAVERDETFARSLAAAVHEARTAPQAASSSAHVNVSGATGGRYQTAGRDMRRNVDIDLGGLVPAVAAILILILVVVLVLALR